MSWDGSVTAPDDVRVPQSQSCRQSSRFRGILPLCAFGFQPRCERRSRQDRVTDVATGRSITVRVNDRGPFVRGRVVDVSRGAAQTLGITGKGVAKVKIDVVESADASK